MRKAALLVLMLLGCPKRAKEPADLLQPLLVEADRAWLARGTNGFPPVENALLKGQGVFAASPELAWRWARLRIAQGTILETEQARVAAYGEARSLAWTCVLAEPRVRAMEIEVGLEEALRFLPESRLGCLTWATHAWVRWLSEFGGDGGAIDLGELDALLTVASDTLPDEERWLTSWSEGLLAAVRPERYGRDLNRARGRLQRASEDGPEKLGPLIDLYQFVGKSSGDVALLEKLQQTTAAVPEDAAMLKRVLE